MRMHSYVILLACLMAAACNPSSSDPRDIGQPGQGGDVDQSSQGSDVAIITTLRENGLRLYWDRKGLVTPGEQIERIFLLDENV